MKLPEKFQMRLKEYPGFTHTCKVDGEFVKVKWARGWREDVKARTGRLVEWNNVSVSVVLNMLQDQSWIIVDEKKSVKSSLPDEFYFINSIGETLKAVYCKNERYYDCYAEGDLRCKVTADGVKSQVKIGLWRIINYKHLTAEQKRANKEIRERISALQSSIKLNQQDIHHKGLLIKNYEEQIVDLEAKIVEGE